MEQESLPWKCFVSSIGVQHEIKLFMYLTILEVVVAFYLSSAFRMVNPFNLVVWQQGLLLLALLNPATFNRVCLTLPFCPAHDGTDFIVALSLAVASLVSLLCVPHLFSAVCLLSSSGEWQPDPPSLILNASGQGHRRGQHRFSKCDNTRSSSFSPPE